jgi:hypothetical protein
MLLRSDQIMLTFLVWQVSRSVALMPETAENQVPIFSQFLPTNEKVRSFWSIFSDHASLSYYLSTLPDNAKTRFVSVPPSLFLSI